MSKKQTGLRMDRVLYVQFQQLCIVEKLRPGEAAEQLVRMAVDSGSIAETVGRIRPGRGAQLIDEVLFKSRLSRLKASLESEKRYWMETGEVREEPESEEIVKELVDLARRSIGPELVQEFQTILSDADRLYEEIEKTEAELWIKRYKAIQPMIDRATLPNRSRELPGT